MPESPLSIRVNEEVKNSFNQLAEQGDFENKGEFLNRLLTAYQAELVKNSGGVAASLLKPAIETVETLTSRLLETLNGTAAAVDTRNEQQRQILEEKNKSFEETRLLLQQHIKALEQDKIDDSQRIQVFIADKETAEQQVAEFQNRTKELEHIADDKQALIDEYKSKNDTLTSIVNEYKSAFDENQNLKTENIGLRQKIIDMESQIKALNTKLEEQTTRHTEALGRLKDTLNLEHEKALLELRTKHQRELQDGTERYNEKVNALLERLEKQTDAPKATKVGK